MGVRECLRRGYGLRILAVERFFGGGVMSHRASPTDLTDAPWAILEPVAPPPQPGGRPSGHDPPPWHAVSPYVRLWRLDGPWEHINVALSERVRRQAGRDPAPSAAISDSQSV